MSIDLTGRLYKKGDKVYFGTTEITVHNQRGRLYIKHKGRQTNIKDVPVLPKPEKDCVFNYIFGGGSVTHPCPAMEYWIYRHRLGHRITTREYRRRFLKPGEG